MSSTYKVVPIPVHQIVETVADRLHGFMAAQTVERGIGIADSFSGSSQWDAPGFA
ncbi:MAG: hypothetical protein ABWZ75_12880 [Novosphingobium sp.]